MPLEKFFSGNSKQVSIEARLAKNIIDSDLGKKGTTCPAPLPATTSTTWADFSTAG